MSKRNNYKKVEDIAPVLRPFTTYYAGTWNGHCKTRESAIKAAVKRVVDGEYSSCSITGPDGDVARVRRDNTDQRVTITTEKPLRRVK